MDLLVKYKLKRQYKLGVADNCNYIIAYNGTKCVYLNPMATFVLNSVIHSENLNMVIGEMCTVFAISKEEAVTCVEKVIGKLIDYLEEDNSRRVIENTSVENQKAILMRSNKYKCPIQKAKHPRKIKFYLTENCPRNCIYCFAGAKHTRMSKCKCENFLSVERFKDIILEARDCGVTNIEVSGGDPFVIDNIYDYLDVMIKYFPYDWGTSTKALISPDEAKKLADINLSEMQVSLDSFNPNVADKLMGVKNSFYEVLETINNLQKVGIAVTTKTTITSINIYDVPELFENFVKMGIKRIRFAYYYASANRHRDMLFPTNEQFQWLNDRMAPIVQKSKEYGVTTDFYPHEPYSAVNNDTKRLICGGFTDSMSVRPDGGVLFCDSLNHCDDFVAGNLKTNGIMQVWNGEGVRNMNTPMYFHEKYHGTKCYNCHLFENCFYKRCYVRTYAEYGRYFDVDPTCPFGKEGYIIKN